MLDKHLVLINHNGKSVLPSSYCSISAASKISKNITALIIGENEDICTHLYEEIKNKVDKAVYVCDESFKTPVADSYSHAISHTMSALNFNYLWAESNNFMKETIPRVSAQLPEASMISDVQEVIDNDTFKKPVWSGNIIATVKISSKIKIITIRTTDFQDGCTDRNSSTLEKIALEVRKSNIKFMNFEEIKSDRPSLLDAKIVIAGGRGLKNKEDFAKYIFPLADALNAAVGASRAVCDAEWVPNDWQVGQTGKIVAPELYIAIGISGAIQHVAGMRGSKTIVAINKDIEAPIFQVADYGLVGNAESIIPEFIDKIKKIS